ncbi:MAG: DNA polymerase III subunit gamma/tau [Cyanobacteria bacterium CRU_2_1]|nr:DNA polymerase III subunit gamma/tau [Cyanobacteria bacterium CRU_2_1]
MPYEPLHHKYRPQTFAELVGQEAIAATLTNALRQQRIAPAYLFTGARGTGKTSSARILAKSLNCLSSDVPTEQPCGTCEVCRRIANSSALDVIEIDAASNTGVDNIRELIERSQFAPVQCRYKVYVLDEVHMLTGQAFNALLKTLEEPPDRIVFVLATTDPQRVLPTIISRCQRFDFRRIPLDAMVHHLAKIADKEAIDITPDAIQLIAQISQGGLRDAESLLDQVSLLDGQVTVERVWDLVGAVPERDLLALVNAIAQDDATTVLDRARRLMDRGREPLIVLQNLASFYRDLLIAKTSPDRHDLVAITPPTWAEMCKFTQSLDISTILHGQQRLRESEGQVKNTAQPRLWLEVTLIGLLPSAFSPHPLPFNPQRTVLSPQPSTLNSQPSTLNSQPSTLNSQPSTLNASIKPIVEEPVSRAIDSENPHELSSLDSLSNSLSNSIPDSLLTVDLERTAESMLDGVVEETEEAKEGEEIHPQANLQQIWEEMITHIRFPGTQALLRQQCYLLAIEGQEVRIGIKSQPLFQIARKQLPNVEAAFEAMYSYKVKINLEVVAAPETRSQLDNEFRPSHCEPSATSPPSKPIAREASAPWTPRTSSNPSGHLSGYAQQKPEQESDRSPPLPPSTASPHSESPSSSAWQEEDEVSGAAKSLAQFFNGQIVSLENELPSESTAEELPLEQRTAGLDEIEADAETSTEMEPGEADDDVPF